MIIKHSLAVGILCALAVTAPLTDGAASTYGLSPELQQRLAVATKFTCDGGAQTLAVARVNDNYCDCADGSDEPGTAACSHTDAKFYCANAGYFPKNIPTSRVNDHVCDCCDGSDEYGSGTACPITCASLMATFESEKRELLDEFDKGFSARQQLVSSAKEFFEQDTKQLATLESELATLKQSVSHMEKVKEAEELAETKERMDKAKETKKTMLSKLGLDQLTKEQLGFLVLELANANYNKDEVLRFIKAERGDEVGESALEKEEAAWKIRDEERQKETERVNALIEERRKAKLEKEKEREEAIERGETPEETKEEEEEEPEPERPPVEDRPVYSLFNQMHSFSSYERPQAKTARDSYNDANSKVYSTERTLKELKEGLERAYGPDNVLYALKDKCFETSGGQYKYSMCFFGKAKQDHTSLGEMQAFDADKEELFFSGGATCWNGPARSLRVSLECGVEPELYGVDEPSTCVYTAKFKTPLACDASYKSRLVAVDGESSDGTPHHIEVAVEATL